MAEVMSVTDEDVKLYLERKKNKGRRDQRVCVCGHGGGAHFDLTSEGRAPDSLEKGQVGCQAGKVPCNCDEFKWVLTMKDIRSFIQKTEGPDEQHALAKGLVSSRARGLEPEWREGIRCFYCRKDPSEVGTLIPIAYNERGGEAFRSTNDNRMHCAECRENIRQMVARG